MKFIYEKATSMMSFIVNDERLMRSGTKNVDVCCHYFEQNTRSPSQNRQEKEKAKLSDLTSHTRISYVFVH